jgi:hypothetical protein
MDSNLLYALSEVLSEVDDMGEVFAEIDNMRELSRIIDDRERFLDTLESVYATEPVSCEPGETLLDIITRCENEHYVVTRVEEFCRHHGLSIVDGVVRML